MEQYSTIIWSRKPKNIHLILTQFKTIERNDKRQVGEGDSRGHYLVLGEASPEPDFALFLHPFFLLHLSLPVSPALLQAENFSGCCGRHLCDFCHVLRPSQLCPLFNPGESEQSQAPPICQRSEPHHLLADQLPLGHCKCQVMVPPSPPSSQEGWALCLL